MSVLLEAIPMSAIALACWDVSVCVCVCVCGGRERDCTNESFSAGTTRRVKGKWKRSGNIEVGGKEEKERGGGREELTK